MESYFWQKNKFMYTKIMLSATLFFLLVSCKKEDPQAIAWQEEISHLCIKWRVESAHKNNTGNELDNGEDVSYDWDKWSIQFWNNNAYEIIEYSPDSSACILESGTWQLGQDGKMILKGSEKLVDFDSGTIIDEGNTEKFWLKEKNENKQFWIWIENSIYGSSGVFLKMLPY